MEKARILIVDDEIEILEIVRVLLESEGYEIIEASNGNEALQKLNSMIDLVILDVMMPEMSGYKVCLQIRERCNVPILFLTAKTKESDLIMGFSSGGDDYLAKPFSYTELVARVKGLLRRYHVYKGKDAVDNSEYICIQNLEINRDCNEIRVDGKEVLLTDIEYKMLILMAVHRKKIFSAQNLYESVWNEPFYASSTNTIMVHIRKLREKIEADPQNPKYIKTVWGKGYRID